MSDNKQLVINQLLELSRDLGRTPKRQEFEAEFAGIKYQIQKQFGNYQILLQAAGLDPNWKRRKVDNTIFETKIEQHLERYHEQVRPQSRTLTPFTAAIISDIHWPFSNNKVVDRFIEYVADEKPEHVIINGDAWDFYSHAKFPRSHNVFTPREEEAKARAMNEEFWRRIKSVHAKAICTQMLGNHDIRPMKRILEEYPEAEDWIKEKLSKLFSFDGVRTIMDPRQELMLNENTAVFHGYRGKLGDHRDFTLMNCINGHTHKGGVVVKTVRGELIWELNSGLAGDAEAKGLTYTPQKISIWTPGFGVVNKYGPQFIGVP
jgi:predicted phosphodiesterase